MFKSCVVIPVYRKIIDRSEILSLRQGLKIFANHQIIFICPESFDESWLDEYQLLHSQITFKKFEDKNFKNVESYSLLLMTPSFYERFSDYDFMLIYQTDAYVFSNQLNYWCEQGFDYIGAPWFKNFDTSGVEKEFIKNAGNGGFSLRNVAKINFLMKKKLSFLEKRKFRKVLSKTEFKPKNKLIFNIRFFLKKNLSEICASNCYGNIPNEDHFFAWIFPKIFPEFKVATAEEAIAFSFESQPEHLYKMNADKLPFGCHAWQKYSPEFWEKFIPKDL